MAAADARTAAAGGSTTATGASTTDRRNPWLVLTVLCLGFFIVLLDTTIVNIAVPELTASLSARLDQVLWIVNAYTIAYAVLLITGGRLGDLYGQRRMFLIGLTLFTVASAACGLAQSPSQLIATRLLQGVGGALLSPQTLAILTVTFPANRRGAAFGIWGGVAGLATIAGPTFGGWLVSSLGWRWIFYVNVPIGVATVTMAALLLPDIRLNHRLRLDWLGTGTVSLAVFLICFGLIEGPSYGWGQVWRFVTIPLILAAGAGALVLFGWRQWARRHHEPLVPPEVLADRNFTVMSAVVAAVSFGMLGLFLPLVIFLQSVLSLSALQAGLVLAPMSLASVVAAPLAGRLADRYGGKDTLVTGLVLWAGGIALVSFSTSPYDQRTPMLIGLMVAGLGLGLTFAPLQSIAMHRVVPRIAGAAAGVMNTARQLGAVLGSAAVGALLQAQLASRLGQSARANVDALPLSFRPRFLDGFERAASGRGLHVGVGQAGAHLPADIPDSIRPAIEQVAFKTFADAYIPSMRTALILPIVVLALAAVGALLVRRPDGTAVSKTAAIPDAGAPPFDAGRVRTSGR